MNAAILLKQYDIAYAVYVRANTNAINVFSARRDFKKTSSSLLFHAYCVLVFENLEIDDLEKYFSKCKKVDHSKTITRVFILDVLIKRKIMNLSSNFKMPVSKVCGYILEKGNELFSDDYNVGLHENKRKKESYLMSFREQIYDLVVNKNMNYTKAHRQLKLPVCLTEFQRWCKKHHFVSDITKNKIR